MIVPAASHLKHFAAPIWEDRRDDYSVLVLACGISIAVDRQVAAIIKEDGYLLRRHTAAPHHVFIYHPELLPPQGTENRFVRLADWIAADCNRPKVTRNPLFMYMPATFDANDYRRLSLATKKDLDRRAELLMDTELDIRWDDVGYTALAPGDRRTDPEPSPERALERAANLWYEATVAESIKWLTLKKKAREVREYIEERKWR